MLIVELTYKKPLSEVDKCLQEHRRFLDKYYEKGILIASGPKHPRDGGIILARTNQQIMQAIIKEDPFFINDIADYTIIEFNPIKHAADFKHFVD